MEKVYNYNDLINKLRHAIKISLDYNTSLYTNLLGKIEVLNPIKTLKRGYSISRINEKVIQSVKDVKANDNIKIEVCDGVIDAFVK